MQINHVEQGFILTRHWKDTPTGIVKPLLTQERNCELTALPLKDFNRQPVAVLYCRHYRQLQHLEHIFKEQNIPHYETDIRPPDRLRVTNNLSISN
ncbi:hypothetical protein [Xenorhabdus sp. BG5]|uniref:hypothetical protein n=1 Tax=Xenorhabdus sp. BG5 TaxID=2782014 RepID=UPI00187E1C05|nr:hypothetical protein [Xenorhabdus sp. BG5]MBE8597496.1 hypothetical protein [Xenorhabdus sp. BG5]